jgi:hypothetical protein
MKKVTLEFTERQAWEIFHMMEEGSVGRIEYYEMNGDHHSDRVCRRAMKSFHEQLLDQQTTSP